MNSTDRESSDVVNNMAAEIVRLCDPCLIYLVSSKKNPKGDIISLKLCVVVDDSESTEAVESNLLLSTDCPVPCDFIVYGLSDWNDCAEDDCSFAYRVENGGERIYVKSKP